MMNKDKLMSLEKEFLRTLWNSKALAMVSLDLNKISVIKPTLSKKLLRSEILLRKWAAERKLKLCEKLRQRQLQNLDHGNKLPKKILTDGMRQQRRQLVQPLSLINLKKTSSVLKSWFVNFKACAKDMLPRKTYINFLFLTTI